MKTKWFIHDYMNEMYAWKSKDVVKTLQELGIDYELVEFSSKDVLSNQFEWPIINNGDCNLFYGSYQFCSNVPKGIFPGCYGLNSNISYDVYSCNIPNDWFLNSNYAILPAKILVNNWHFHTNKDLFIRPVSGSKVFAGDVFSQQEFIDLRVQDETMCVFAEPQKIIREFRFIIGNREVIDGSQYHAHLITNFRHDWTPEAYELAQKVAKLEWQPDLVYSCDVAETEFGYKIVELNSFSCCGLYSMDLHKVFSKVTEIAIKETLGEI